MLVPNAIVEPVRQELNSVMRPCRFKHQAANVGFATLRAESLHVLNRLEPALIYGAGLFSTGLRKFVVIHDVGELFLNRRFEYIVRKHVAHYLPQMMSTSNLGNIYQVSDMAEAKLISPGIHHALAAAARSTV